MERFKKTCIITLVAVAMLLSGGVVAHAGTCGTQSTNTCVDTSVNTGGSSNSPQTGNRFTNANFRVTNQSGATAQATGTAQYRSTGVIATWTNAGSRQVRPGTNSGDVNASRPSSARNWRIRLSASGFTDVGQTARATARVRN